MFTSNVPYHFFSIRCAFLVILILLSTIFFSAGIYIFDWLVILILLLSGNIDIIVSHFLYAFLSGVPHCCVAENKHVGSVPWTILRSTVM